MTFAQSAAESYARMFRQYGEQITVRRGTGAGAVSMPAWASIKGYAPDELVGDISQGDRRVTILADGLALDPPLSTADRLIVRGEPLAIRAIDDSTRRISGVLLAYEVQARGH